jgi:REP element-mobilizing transposase RayT
MRTPEGWPCRRSIRLQNFDYSRPGAYFVTIGTRHGLDLFGKISNGLMRLNPAGRMVSRVWHELPEHCAGVGLDAFVVMPDHIHGIVVLRSGDSRRITLSDVVHRFKSFTTAQYRRGVRAAGWPPFPGRLWHRNYYERIVRDEGSLLAIRRYIAENPLRG